MYGFKIKAEVLNETVHTTICKTASANPLFFVFVRDASVSVNELHVDKMSKIFVYFKA